ncbi:hypothetical protein BD408DRAFT_413907 [Parasitella parasitica]|nr:hypothetical protein BD408DRAFT_413907 [Parasitella parasitica]
MPLLSCCIVFLSHAAAVSPIRLFNHYVSYFILLDKRRMLKFFPYSIVSCLDLWINYESCRSTSQTR